MSSVSTRPILRTHAVFASCLAFLVVAAGLAVLPFADASLPPLPILFPISYTTIFVCSTLTVFLLLLQFSAMPKHGMVLLGSAYVFLSVSALLQLLVMSGLARVLGVANPQPLPWLWVFFHSGFSLLLGLSRLVPDKVKHPERISSRVAVAMAMPLLLSVALGILLVHHSDHLPVLMIGDRRTPAFDRALICMNVETLGMLTIGLVAGVRDRLDMWVAVTLVVYLVDEMLAAATHSRYTVGWLASASVAMLSAMILLCTQLWEIRDLYLSLIRLNSDLEHQAFRDALTGLFSRRYFDQRFPHALEEAVAARQPLCLMLLDADHFKVCNDRYGHQAGDQFLVQLARALSAQTLRPGQFVARYGGEEFVAVLPQVGMEQAPALAESLRCAVERNFSGAGERAPARLTVSIGVACLPDFPQPVESSLLLKIADQALYEAKRAGRNCVRVRAVDSPVSVDDLRDERVKPLASRC